jgi:hemerythrin
MASTRPSAKLTGLRLVDDEHAALVAQLDRLEIGLAAGNTSDTEAALAFLLEYVLAHFAHEEAQLAASGWPGLAAHRALHADLSGRLDQLIAAHHAGDPGLPQAVAALLDGWLVAHINEADQEWATELFEDRLAATGAIKS